MKVGFLHLGPPSHGVCRYGKLIARAVRELPGADVEELALERPGHQGLREASRRLASMDVAHVQYNARALTSIWGSGPLQLWNLRAFLAAHPAPVVVTIHDLAGEGRPHRTARQSPIPGGRRVALRIKDEINALQLERWPLRYLLDASAAVVVASSEERRRLLGRLPDVASKLHVIPHMLEARTASGDAGAARTRFDLHGRRVVTLLGFVHPRKGHSLLVETLPLLPPDVVVVFAGGAGPGWAWYVDALRRRAHELGRGGQLRITGYLDEDSLDAVLEATDLAACPFEDVSASGSLATVIAADRRILASSLPLVHELQDLAPGAMASFEPYTPEGLAAGIRQQLDTAPDPAGQRARRSLRQALAPAAIGKAHLELYTSVSATARGGGR